MHYHFGGSDNTLFEQATIQVGIGMQDFIPLYFGSYEKLRLASPVECYVRASLAWIEKFPHHASFWVYHCYALTLKDQHADTLDSVWEGGRKRMRELILEGMGSGIYKRKHEILELSWSLHSMLVSAMFSATILRSKTRSQVELKHLLKNIEYMLLPN